MVATGMIAATPLSKAAQIAEVALKTSITTTISYSALCKGYKKGEKQTSICFRVSFIISELISFFSFFWAFFHSSLIPSIEIGGVWPPRDLQDVIVDPFGVPLLNTCILLTSGLTVTWCHKLVIKPIYEEGEAIVALTITIGLAILFLLLQLMEYKNAVICLSDGIYGSTFYMTTGFHGFHVMIGTIFLIVCNYRLALGHFEDGNCVGLESAIWYWHFVDVVWIILFCFVYIWGNLKTEININPEIFFNII